MDKLPFTVYDFFGYLASGFIVLVAITAAFVGYDPLKSSSSATLTILFIVVAYVAGHIVANLAGDLLERRIVRAQLGMPTGLLVGSRLPSQAAKVLLPGYSTPLPEGVRSRVLDAAQRRGVSDRGEALFFHCHAVMKNDQTVQGRLNVFLNLYGFCRNMTMALLLAAVALGVGLVLGTADTGPDIPPGWWLGAAVVAAVGLFYRYLKFLRQFGVELLTSYAETA